MSTPPPPPPPKEDGSAPDALVEAVLGVLAVGAPVAATAAALAAVLGVAVGVALAFLGALGAAVLASFTHATAGGRPTTAAGIAAAANLRYRAAFIINALRRIAAAPDMGVAIRREVDFFHAHLRAGERRLVMGRRVDAMRRAHGDLLGWYAKNDARTSAECRAASGRNFLALSPPVIGYPGGVHPHCRCLPGPPFPGAKMVDASLTVRRSDAASGFHRRSS